MNGHLAWTPNFVVIQPMSQKRDMGHPDLWKRQKQIPPLRYGMTNKRLRP